MSAVAFHPSGHLFSVGYTDGCIAFWALEDDSRPLVVRTLATMHVNTINALELESFLGSTLNDNQKFSKEPIFKLSWSGYTYSSGSSSRRHNTTLTILGGFDVEAKQESGLSVLLLPDFNATVPLAEETVVPGMLSPSLRKAMCESLVELDIFVYDSPGIIQDYLLVPRGSPHFSGTFDPYAILFMTDSSKNHRSLEVVQYPPSHFMFKPKESTEAAPLSPLEPISGDLVTQLQRLELLDESRRLPLPFCFSNGRTGLLNGHILKLEKEPYLTLIDQGTSSTERLGLNLKGGRAWPDETKMNELKLSKVSLVM